MAKDKRKFRLKKRLERYADNLITDSSVWGFDFEDAIINTRGRRVTASGYLRGFGEVTSLSKFNRNAKELKAFTMSVDYDNVDARMVQQFKFSNYKKFVRASEGSHKKRYEAVVDLVGNVRTLQKGVDLWERMPGMSDVNMRFHNLDTGEIQNFM